MILDERLYKVLSMIEKFALESNGIIWGSYVTAKISHRYFSELYYNLDLPIDKYWDHSFHPETIERTFRCEEISICFPKITSFDKFNYKCLDNNITIRIFDKDDEILMEIEEYPEIVINIILRTEDVLPPFGSLLFLCDGFIMHNKNNTTIIEYSRNTGTMIDKIDTKKFKIAENNIINDIYKKKTIISDINEGTIAEIYKFINDGWTISNLPYSVFSKSYDITDTELDKFNENCCVICLDKLFKDNKTIKEIAVVYSDISHPNATYYPIHHSCFIEYILYKNSKKFYCPFKYLINFDNCNITFNYQYYMINRNKH
jgi:hypothetical protein